MIYTYMKQAIGNTDKMHVIRIGDDTEEALEEKRVNVYLRDGWDNATEEEYNDQFEAIGDPDNIVESEDVEEETDTESEDVPPPLTSDEEFTD